MSKDSLNFDDWFESLVDILAIDSISFRDRDAVEDDYNSGRSVFEVAEEIKAEYAE